MGLGHIDFWNIYGSSWLQGILVYKSESLQDFLATPSQQLVLISVEV